MKKLFFFIALTLLSVNVGFSQTRKVSTKTSAPKSLPAKSTVSTETITEIAAAEWNEIVKSLEAENWSRASLLSSAAMKKLKTDNEKKQLARLRYFYVYSLAGKIAQKTMLPAELERISPAFINQDFLMPSREVSADCTGKVNYICHVKADETSLRVTATNKTASAINSFEYVKLPEKFDLAANDGKQIFLGGKLKRMEIGNYKNNTKIVKLFFEDGYADIVKNNQ